MTGKFIGHMTVVSALTILSVTKVPGVFSEGPDARGTNEATKTCNIALATALGLRFDQSTAAQVKIVRHHGRETEEIRIQSARKFIRGRMHSIVRFMGPAEYRGWRTLTIDNLDRSDDHFIFMRSLNRVKRVRAEPADAFFATDFSLEDLERRTEQDYATTDCGLIQYEDELAWRIHTVPLHPTLYARTEFIVATSDYAQLAARHFQRNAQIVSKEIQFPRSGIEKIGGIPIAMVTIARNVSRKTETRAVVEKIVLDPDLPDVLFSTTALEVDRQIPGL